MCTQSSNAICCIYDEGQQHAMQKGHAGATLLHGARSTVSPLSHCLISITTLICCLQAELVMKRMNIFAMSHRFTTTVIVLTFQLYLAKSRPKHAVHSGTLFCDTSSEPMLFRKRDTKYT